MNHSQKPLTDEQLNYISLASEQQDMHSIWGDFDTPLGTRPVIHKLETFAERREGFLWTLKRLLENGHMQLGYWSDRSLVTGTPDEQVDIIRQAFPANDEGMEDGLWFFPVGCPVGVLWEWPGRDPKPFVD